MNEHAIRRVETCVQCHAIEIIDRRSERTGTKCIGNVVIRQVE
jgi:hypothetical protein